MKKIFYVLLTAMMVFACGLIPALGANDATGATSWIVALWGSFLGTVATVGGYWCGAMVEGSAVWDSKNFLCQLLGAVIGGGLACMVLAFPG